MLPFPTIAAVNGAAIAGGCITTMFCDYRYLVKGTKIGMNETAFGLPLPYGVHRRAKEIVGLKIADRMSLEGTLFTAEQALEIGLVDGLANDEDELLALAQNKMKLLLKNVNSE